MLPFPLPPLPLPEQHGIQQDPQRHQPVWLTLMLDQQADQGGWQGRCVRERTKREPEKQIGLAAAPVVQEEVALRRPQLGEIEAGDQIRQKGGDQLAQVAGIVQESANGPIREIVQVFRFVKQRHRRAPLPVPC